MFLQLRNYLKTEKHSLAVAIIVMFLITLLFAGYLKFFGLPMTRARNSYNEAMLLLTVDDSQKAKTKLEESLEYWYTDEAAFQLAELLD